MAHLIVNILSMLTLISGIALVLTVALFLKENLILKRKINLGVSLRKFFAKKYLYLSFLIALTATLGSLFFSLILKYTPCELCWYQRIFMYPLVLIFIMAIVKNDKRVYRYSLPVAIIGFLIAAFHYYLQLSNTQSFSCNIVGYSASCTETFFLTYGYITIPMMAITAFALIIALSLNYKYNKENVI